MFLGTYYVKIFLKNHIFGKFFRHNFFIQSTGMSYFIIFIVSLFISNKQLIK